MKNMKSNYFAIFLLLSTVCAYASAPVHQINLQDIYQEVNGVYDEQTFRAQLAALTIPELRDCSRQGHYLMQTLRNATSELLNAGADGHEALVHSMRSEQVLDQMLNEIDNEAASRPEYNDLIHQMINNPEAFRAQLPARTTQELEDLSFVAWARRGQVEFPSNVMHAIDIELENRENNQS